MVFYLKLWIEIRWVRPWHYSIDRSSYTVIQTLSLIIIHLSCEIIGSYKDNAIWARRFIVPSITKSPMYYTFIFSANHLVFLAHFFVVYFDPPEMQSIRYACRRAETKKDNRGDHQSFHMSRSFREFQMEESSRHSGYLRTWWGMTRRQWVGRLHIPATHRWILGAIGEKNVAWRAYSIELVTESYILSRRQWSNEGW